jgi:4-hydroxythreonine-4-phosphate dehydrogenase
MRKVAISVGDLNGIGIQLALESHYEINKLVQPIYCIDIEMLYRASTLLNIKIPQDFQIVGKISEPFKIKAGEVTKESGIYSFASFLKAIELAKLQEVIGIVTLPINKQAWNLAQIKYKGHTDTLKNLFHANAIMMLGHSDMFVALYTEHIPLQDVPKEVKNISKLSQFLIDFYYSINLDRDEQIALLGLNPHAGDGGILGDDEVYITEARNMAHKKIGRKIYTLPVVPDIAFTPNIRKKYRYFVALYHDQGLAPLKALYFDESINVSLNLPIKRSSVDHGTAFDRAYKNIRLNHTSYINAIKYLLI